ncbi:uncharacterized protein LOC126574971 [Anopheles aquasalis]|uniref:uncharacterized protein LOC126574971 n=1 Tax=Anopheles aquasalis TaxID=42839 RepID=UPI00215B0C0D|nr:uncharacterized protein LOC126574971 [Anopheles aquasalis]
MELVDPSNPQLLAELVNGYRMLLQEQITQHIKTHRDHLVRMRKRFAQKLARRLARNYELFRRKWRQLPLESKITPPKPIPKKPVPPPIKQYSRRWWKSVANGKEHFNEELFRMDYACFRLLCERLNDELAAECITHHWIPLSNETKVAIALYVLGTGADYRKAGVEFEVPISTVHKCLLTFCNAVVYVFLEEEELIYLPVDEHADELENVVEEFELQANMPRAMGVLDCMHIAIAPPEEEPESYINSNGWSSVILQVAVDSNGCFMDVSQHSGCTNDETVLFESPIYETMERQQFPTIMLNDKPLNPFLLADSGYPLLPWLMTPYHGENLSPAQRSFNVYVARARAIASKAFERLTGRWKLLQGTVHLGINIVPTVIMACCLLHNFLEFEKAPYMDQWSECAIEADAVHEQPIWLSPILNEEGEEIRNHLSAYMEDNFPVVIDDI